MKSGNLCRGNRPAKDSQTRWGLIFFGQLALLGWCGGGRLGGQPLHVVDTESYCVPLRVRGCGPGRDRHEQAGRECVRRQ